MKSFPERQLKNPPCCHSKMDVLVGNSTTWTHTDCYLIPDHMLMVTDKSHHLLILGDIDLGPKSLLENNRQKLTYGEQSFELQAKNP